MSNYLFFWRETSANGFCSNWYPAPFTRDGKLFPTSEHYMMYHKALLMEDSECAAKILQTDSPKIAQKLGRKTKTWDEQLWIDNRERIMLEACTLKFKQNTELQTLLIKTHPKILVEASPFDKIWGIGLSASHKDAANPKKWKGLNLLGKTLVQVRNLF